MPRPFVSTRRTALKTLGGVGLGSVLLPGTVGARQGDSGQSPSTTDVRITAEHDHESGAHRFVVENDEVPSGWTTIEFANPTDHTHFALLQKIPAAALEAADEAGMPVLEYWNQEIVDPFQEFMDLLLGKPNSFSGFPKWFGDIVPAGGPGLTTGGNRSKTTVNLDPGRYQIECYVKTADNEFHSYHGMSGLLTVTDQESDDREPRATVDLTLDTSGLSAPSRVRPGMHRVGVTFDEQRAYSHLLGHDVHLIRYDSDTDRDEVDTWMDWSNGLLTSTSADDQEGLVSDGDEPGTFLGGVQNIWTALPQTGYVHVNLAPGTYAWVAEVPSPDDKGLLREFTVPG